MENFEERLTKLEQSIEKLTQKMEESAKPKEQTRKVETEEEADKRLKKNTYEYVERILNGKQDVLAIGYFDNGDVSSRFSLCASVEKIKIIDSFEAEKLFSVLANQDRIEIIKILLNHCATSTEIMEKCGFETTGKFYHHINMLMNLDIVKKAQNGTYLLDAKRVGYIIPILSCVNFIAKEEN